MYYSREGKLHLHQSKHIINFLAMSKNGGKYENQENTSRSSSFRSNRNSMRSDSRCRKAGDYQISATGVDTATITSYSGSATNLTIPSKLNGMKITQIDFNAFSGNKKLTKVTIPDTVTTIGNSAFEDCTSLASVNIPSSVTGIGVAAFDNTKILNNQSKASAQYIGKWLISADTENISVKVGTVGIADYACFFNENLTTLKLPSGLKYIGICSFGLCTNLSSANIPATVEKSV